MSADPYWRRISVLRIIDGDTVESEIDCGWNTYTVRHVRLLGVNCPELFHGTPEVRAAGALARDFTTAWVAEHRAHGAVEWPFNMRSEKDDSFGRYLGWIECGTGHALSTALLDSGNAVPFTRSGGSTP